MGLSSKNIEIRFVLLLLLRNELLHSEQDQTRSVLDRIRHDQGFPNLSRKMAAWGWIFRDKFGKSGQDQTRSGFPKFVTENGWLRLDFLWRIWETLSMSDPVQISQICHGKSSISPKIYKITTPKSTKITTPKSTKYKNTTPKSTKLPPQSLPHGGQVWSWSDLNMSDPVQILQIRYEGKGSTKRISMVLDYLTPKSW